MTQEQLKTHLIEMYRVLIEERYQFDALSSAYELPKFITREMVDTIRAYFLTYVYPEAETRQSLDAAFDSLDGHVKAPGNLMRLLMDASSILFKYGRHLPKIFKTGVKALQSFRKASGFESMLLQKAMENDSNGKLSLEEIKRLIAQLPYEEVNSFIEGNDVLFDALIDHKLMDKTIDIMNTLVQKMKKRPKVYGPADIEGVEIGRTILKGGVALVRDMSDEESRSILELVKQVEHDSIDAIFEEYQSMT